MILYYIYPAALVFTESYFGEWNRVEFGAYTCPETETNLIGCSYNSYYIYHSYYCNSQQLAGVRCQLYTKGTNTAQLYSYLLYLLSHITVECNNGEIRLVGGESSDEGRLEICYNDIWTPVCVTYFHDEEAAVACKQLGYTHYSCTYVTLSLIKFIISLYYRGFYIHCWKYTTGQAIYYI